MVADPKLEHFRRFYAEGGYLPAKKRLPLAMWYTQFDEGGQAGSEGRKVLEQSGDPRFAPGDTTLPARPPTSSVERILSLLPADVRESYRKSAEGLIGMTPPAAVRDYVESSQDLARNALSGDLKGTGMASLATLLAGVGMIGGRPSIQFSRALGVKAPENVRDSIYQTIQHTLETGNEAGRAGGKYSSVGPLRPGEAHSVPDLVHDVPYMETVSNPFSVHTHPNNSPIPSASDWLWWREPQPHSHDMWIATPGGAVSHTPYWAGAKEGMPEVAGMGNAIMKEASRHDVRERILRYYDLMRDFSQGNNLSWNILPHREGVASDLYYVPYQNLISYLTKHPTIFDPATSITKYHPGVTVGDVWPEWLKYLEREKFEPMSPTGRAEGGQMPDKQREMLAGWFMQNMDSGGRVRQLRAMAGGGDDSEGRKVLEQSGDPRFAPGDTTPARKAPVSSVERILSMLPADVRDSYRQSAEGLIGMTPPAAVRDYVESSQDLARNALSGDLKGTGLATLATLLSGVGMVGGRPTGDIRSRLIDKLPSRNSATTGTTESTFGAARRWLESFLDTYRRPITVAAPEDVIPEIMNSGRFKSQFETGNSRGTFDPKYRARVEHDQWDVPLDIDPKLRPIYGHITDRNANTSASGYGNWGAVLDPKVNARSSFYLGDSLDAGVGRAGPYWLNENPLANPDQRQRLARAMKDFTGNDYLRGRISGNFSKTAGALSSPYGYIEAQIHGGLPWSDVRALVRKEENWRAGREALKYPADLEHMSRMTDLPTYGVSHYDPVQIAADRYFEASSRSDSVTEELERLYGEWQTAKAKGNRMNPQWMRSYPGERAEPISEDVLHQDIGYSRGGYNPFGYADGGEVEGGPRYDFLNSLTFGLMGNPSPHPIGVPARNDFPSENEVGPARAADALYGSPYRGHMEPGAVSRRLPAEDVEWAVNNDRMASRSVPVLNDQSRADRLYREALAANRSAVASLGFDPSHFVSTPSGDWTAAGVYGPKSDMVWYNEKYPSASVHESMHRGLEQLRKSGEYVAPRNEEDYVRMMMYRLYGPVEKTGHALGDRMVDQAKASLDSYPTQMGDILDKLERLAADRIKARRPYGGPR